MSLNFDALTSIKVLSEGLMNSNKKITARMGTPLEHLVNCTLNEVEHLTDPTTPYKTEEELQGMDPITQVVGGSKKDFYENCYDEHDANIDGISLEVSNALRNHIAFAKGVVAPSVEELVNDVEEQLARYVTRSIRDHEIVVLQTPSALSNGSLLQELEKFWDVPFNPKFVARFNFPDPSEEELLELIKTNVSGIDDAVLNDLTNVDPTLIRRVFDNYFTTKDFVEIDDREKAMGNLLGFLIASRLYDNPNSESNRTLIEFNNAMADRRNQFALELRKEIDSFTNELEREILVRNVYSNKIYVNKVNYEKWIANDVNNAALFGITLRERTIFRMEDINNEYDSLLNSWNKYVASLNTANASEKFSYTKLAFHAAYERQIVRLDEEAKQSGEPIPSANLYEIRKKGREFIDALSRRDVDCGHYDIGLRLLCATRFAHTDAEIILMGVEQIKKENPDLPIEGAATLAMIGYVAGWVASQMKIEAI